VDAEIIRRIVAEHTEAAAVSGKSFTFRREATDRVGQALIGGGPSAVVLDAPRRVGKTVGLKQLAVQIRETSQLSPQYCDFTDMRLRSAGVQEVVRALVPPQPHQKPHLLLLDEVHYSGDGWARELKFAVDHSGARIAVADSAVAIVRSKLRDELLGRYELVRMHPLSFHEWRQLRSSLAIPVASKDDSAFLQQECAEYLQLGGFASNVSRTGELHAVREWLRTAVVDLAVRDDVGRLRGLRDIDNLERVFVARLANSGSQQSVREDAKLTGASEPTVRSWLRSILDTGLVWELEAHARSAGKFERGQPKLYAVDPSLVAACSVPVFGPGDQQLLGRQVETAVAQGLRCFCERVGGRLSVYQSKRRSEARDGEVDFVVEVGGRTAAIEVTSHNDRKKLTKLPGLARELGADYVAVVSMRSRSETVIVDGLSISLVPLHEILLLLATGQGEWPW
jgi:predicted AAA+ superfamily ATPase